MPRRSLLRLITTLTIRNCSHLLPERERHVCVARHKQNVTLCEKDAECITVRRKTNPTAHDGSVRSLAPVPTRPFPSFPSLRWIKLLAAAARGTDPALAGVDTIGIGAAPSLAKHSVTPHVGLGSFSTIQRYPTHVRYSPDCVINCRHHRRDEQR
jgi:hypothetical protein